MIQERHLYVWCLGLCAEDLEGGGGRAEVRSDM